MATEAALGHADGAREDQFVVSGVLLQNSSFPAAKALNASAKPVPLLFFGLRAVHAVHAGRHGLSLAEHDTHLVVQGLDAIVARDKIDGGAGADGGGRDGAAGTRRIIAQAPRQAGYAPLEAVDGREALTLIGRERPAVVVMDVGMPEIGGFEVVAQMRAQGWMQPVLLLTAHGGGRFSRAGAHGRSGRLHIEAVRFPGTGGPRAGAVAAGPAGRKENRETRGELHFGKIVVDLARRRHPAWRCRWR